MFEDLKAARPGTRSKEKMRLWVTVAACLVLGTAIYGGKTGCAGADADRKVPTAVEEAAKEKEKEKAQPAVELDRGPLLPLAEANAPLAEFDPAALDLVTKAVGNDRLSRRPWKVLTPAEIADADPKEAIGRMIETRGIVRDLDREERDFPDTPPGTGRLWAFALEGPDGTRIAVVRRGSSQDMDEKRPEAWMRLPGSGSGKALKDGDLVQVRGIYLQKRTGTLARLSLPGPTPVLVGREFRFTEEPNPPIEHPSQASFSKIQDRFLKDMRSIESDAAKQIVQWAQAVGHDEIVRRIDSGELPIAPWGREEFYVWGKEMAAESSPNVPDKRTWAPAQRGKVFWTNGILQDFLQEDWDRLPPNAFGVDRRWKVYILSDHHGYLPLTFDSPFPLSAFPGVTGLPKQRVQAYGVYVQTHTVEIGGNPDSKRAGPVDTPFFVLLDLRPREFPGGTPVLENPFFWTWVSLAVFGAVFFLVMSRIEKKERATTEALQLRIRRRQRELGQRPGAPGAKGSGPAAQSADPADPPESRGGDAPGGT
jgi:hypothetical protein